jgi:hypothetical protein
VLGNEEIFAIQRTREIRKNTAYQLGLSPNLISLVPATMSRVSISIDFVLDKENSLAKLGPLINSDSFLAAVSLAPGAAAVAKTIGGLAQKVIQTFIPDQEHLPILQFAGDFDLGGAATERGLQDGYYVILGTLNKQDPLPKPLPKLEVRDDALLADGQPVTQLSYIVLEVTAVPVRTRVRNEGAVWDIKLRDAEGLAQEVVDDPFADDTQKRDVWVKCKALLQEARALLLADPGYVPSEAELIYKTVYKKIADMISGRDPQAPGLAKEAGEILDTKSDRTVMNIPMDEDLTSLVDAYAEAARESQRILEVSKYR